MLIARRELLADRTGGKRGRGALERRVLLDEKDRAPETGIGRQMIGDRGAMDGAADDDDVVGRSCGSARR